jgi:Family of unknown function (DUF5335)
VGFIPGRIIMAATEIDRDRWATFLETITNSLVGKQAEIEVVSLRLGDQIEAEWTPLIGIAYDHKDDLIEIALDKLDHLVLSPRQLFVDFGVGEIIAAIEIIDEEGTRQIVKFKDPLSLAAPAVS